jgi:hypothetical protein
MQTSSRFLALVALGGALTLAACGGSPDLSPVASTTITSTGDSGSVTASGNGPGGPTSPSPGTGTCTHDCDGTSQGPGPGAGAGSSPGDGYGPGSGPSDGLCGSACTGPVGPDPADIAAMLELALQEEYKAQYLYQAVLGTFGPDTPPFALIVESEKRHVEALQMLFARRGLVPPPPTPPPFPTYASLALACAAGVAAETEDAAFYSPYLQRTDLPQDVRNVFTNLQAASLENHLPAFERCS